MKQTTKVSRGEVRWGQRQLERAASKIPVADEPQPNNDPERIAEQSLKAQEVVGSGTEYETLQQGVNKALRELGSFVHQRYPRDVVLHARVRAVVTAIERQAYSSRPV